MEKDLIIKECLAIIDSKLKVGDEIGGLQLQREVAKLNPKYEFTYPDSILRELRRTFRDKYVCVKRQKSIYRKIK